MQKQIKIYSKDVFCRMESKNLKEVNDSQSEITLDYLLEGSFLLHRIILTGFVE